MEAIQEQLISLLGVVITVCVSIVTAYIKKWLNAKFNAEQLQQGKEYAKLTVNYVENMFKEAKGVEKFNAAKDKFINSLNEQGIKISEDQIDTILESAVAEMNRVIKDKESGTN